MTIYRTRYRDPKRHSWVKAWSPTHVVAELRRIEVEKRFAPRKVEIEVQRFEGGHLIRPQRVHESRIEEGIGKTLRRHHRAQN